VRARSDVLSIDELEVITRSANIPVLLMVVYQFTGDARWLRPPYRPSRSKGLSDHDSGGLPDELQAEIRRAAAAAFHLLLRGEKPVIAEPDPKLMRKMLAACVGEPVDGSYGEMFSQEFRRRLGEPGDQASASARVPDGFRVLVIGAGVSGIIAARSLARLGVPYLLVDKHAGPGGNWRDNTYPGAAVDTPSHLYTFSFAPNDWASHFEMRPQLEGYLSDAFDQVGASRSARFETEVIRAEFDEIAGRWNVELRAATGEVEIAAFDAIVSAVGVLNRPKLPRIDGIDTFRGPSFHSSQWPSDLDLAGRRVAVIGSGASAMQIVPAIADQVSHLLVFQRTPPWVAPFDKFHQEIAADVRYLLRTFPVYRAWYFLKLYWQLGDKVLDALQKDPAWPHPDRAVSARNDGHRRFFTRYMRDELGVRTDLFEKCLPDYPPYGKRILLDNGWYKALCRPNVTLIDESVGKVFPGGVVTRSGAAHEADVLVWATGFEASRFVSSLEIVGEDGVTLRETWDDDDPRAYLGVSVPGYPNLFLLGGPNSFPGSGSFMYFMEVQMRYISRLLHDMFESGIRVIDVRPEVFRQYSELVDEAAQRTIWSHPGTNTFFRNDRGRLVFVSPFRNVEYWNRAERSGIEEYRVVARCEPAALRVASADSGPR
jgi:4-hydroxyacetophenone monooxygenase